MENKLAQTFAGDGESEIFTDPLAAQAWAIVGYCAVSRLVVHLFYDCCFMRGELLLLWNRDTSITATSLTLQINTDSDFVSSLFSERVTELNHSTCSFPGLEYEEPG